MAEARSEDTAGRKKTSPAIFCLTVGFFAGVIWGLVRWLAVAMNFTRVPAAFLADPLVLRSALSRPLWQWTGFGLFILMSILAAGVYYALLKPLRGPAPGLAFGFLWWAALYLAVGPAIGAVPAWNRIGYTSLITDLCIFLAWGLFIGYSIAYEFHDEAQRESQPAGG